MNHDDSSHTSRSSRNPNPPPMTSLPSIPQLPPITLATSPSVESFTTALSSTSTKDSSRLPSAVDNMAPTLSFTPPASPSAGIYTTTSSISSGPSRTVRTVSSVQHFRPSRPAEPPTGGTYETYFSDFSSDMENRGATPVPANYNNNTNARRITTTSIAYASGSSDVEQRGGYTYAGMRKWESERDEPNPPPASRAGASRGGGSGTMSDSHTPSSNIIIRSKATSAAAAAQPFPSSAATRLHALSNASSSGASFIATNGRTPTSPTVRRDATPVPPIHTNVGKPLPNPNAPSPSGTGSRVVGRARSASLLGMVSSAAALNSSTPQAKDLPRSSSTIQGLQKPRLTLRPATTTSPPIPEFTILVIGSIQCGKSVLISKGLKSWALEKERNVTLGTYTSTVQVPAAMAASLSANSSGLVTQLHEIRGVARIAYFAIKNQTFPIEVVEISAPELVQAGAAWPAVIANGAWGSDKTLSVAEAVKTGVDSLMAGTSHAGRIVDGLVVCYDSSDPESWTDAKRLLEDASHAYTTQPLQAIVVACKTDLLRPPVPTDHTQYHPLLSRQSLEADQYQIGMPDTIRGSGHKRTGSSDDGHGGGDADSGKQPVHKNLGLVPVARTEGLGKKKMRDSFNWLLRRVERAKRHHRSHQASASSASTSAQAQPPPRARTPTPTPPADATKDQANATAAPMTGPPAPAPPPPPSTTTGPQTSFWPAPISNSTPPTTYSSPPANPPHSPRSAAFSSPGNPIPALHQTQSQTQSQSPGSSIRSPKSPTSPTRARSTSDLALDFARGEQKIWDEMMERDREFVAMGLAAKAQSRVVAAAAGGGETAGSGTETRSSGSGLLPSRKTSASATNLRAQAEVFPRPGPVPVPMPMPTSTASVQGSVGRASLAGSLKAALGGVNGDGGDSRRGSNSGVAGQGGEPPRGQSITVSMLPMKAMKEPPPLQYATLDELLDKLVFLSVSEDDEIYIEQFFLMYRRFATPRTILLGLQRRMRELSPPAEDTLLAKYAQMRICNLLEQWMKAFPGDFAAPGAEPALQALIRQTLQHAHTAHYGSDLYSFLSVIPDLTDEEGNWALRENRRRDDDNSSELGLEHDEDSPEAEAIQIAKRASVSLAVSLGAAHASVDSLHHKNAATASSTSLKTPQSGRAGASNGTSPGPKGVASSSKSARTQPSVPLFGEYNPSKGLRGPDAPIGTKPNLRDLLKAATVILSHQPHLIAEEITRLEVPMFLSVHPRDWLRHGLGDRKKTDTPDSIQRMAKFFNYLTMWTASMIVIHDKPRIRAKTIEFFVRVATTLRKLNNYSGLRAVVTGILTSRTDRENDPVMMYLRERHLWKKDFKSLETLLGTSRMHSAYRMALKHTFDAAIPSMEVHTYDIIRANDTNPDYKRDDDTQIHWGKFSLIAKMVLNVVMYQDRFQDTAAFTFPERSDIRESIMNVIIMDEETLYARVSFTADAARSASSTALLSDATSASASRIRQMFQRR